MRHLPSHMLSPKLPVALDLTLSLTLWIPYSPGGSVVLSWRLVTRASRMTWMMYLQAHGGGGVRMRMSAWEAATDCYQLRGGVTVAESANHHVVEESGDICEPSERVMITL